MAVHGTIYSVRDTNGTVMCHSPNQSKANLNSRVKRAVREGFTLMCEAAGVINANGEYMDVHTGAFLPMASPDTARGDLVVIDRGHVISDESDGAFCPCNLVPELRGMNKQHGARSLDPRLFKGIDPRSAWREVWLTHYARPSQVKRVSA